MKRESITMITQEQFNEIVYAAELCYEMQLKTGELYQDLLWNYRRCFCENFPSGFPVPQQGGQMGISDKILLSDPKLSIKEAINPEKGDLQKYLNNFIDRFNRFFGTQFIYSKPSVKKRYHFKHPLTQKEYDDLVFSAIQYFTAKILHPHSIQGYFDVFFSKLKVLLHRESWLVINMQEAIDMANKMLGNDSENTAVNVHTNPKLNEKDAFHQALREHTYAFASRCNNFFRTSLSYSGHADLFRDHLKYHFTAHDKRNFYFGMAMIILSLAVKNNNSDRSTSFFKVAISLSGALLAYSNIKQALSDSMFFIHPPKAVNIFSAESVNFTAIDSRIIEFRVPDELVRPEVKSARIFIPQHCFQEVIKKLESDPRILQIGSRHTAQGDRVLNTDRGYTLYRAKGYAF